MNEKEFSESLKVFENRIAVLEQQKINFENSINLLSTKKDVDVEEVKSLKEDLQEIIIKLKILEGASKKIKNKMECISCRSPIIEDEKGNFICTCGAVYNSISGWSLDKKEDIKSEEKKEDSYFIL